LREFVNIKTVWIQQEAAQNLSRSE
jgi:hypothetical protein